MWEPGEEPSPQGVVVREGFLKEKASCGEEKLARRHRPIRGSNRSEHEV